LHLAPKYFQNYKKKPKQKSKKAPADDPTCSEHVRNSINIITRNKVPASDSSV
jgi:hypothetical protein